MSTLRRTTVFFVMYLIAQCGQLYAADPASDLQLKSERCLDIIRIDHSEILDSHHMLFTMRGKRMYLNTLPLGCPGMRPHDTYMFSTSLSQLCKLDIITLLNRTGAGFMRGASCGLGMFEPVTQEQVDALKHQKSTPVNKAD